MTRKKTKPTPPKQKKSNNAEIARRVNEVYKKIIQRQTRAEILHYASETWQVTERQAQTYISKANELLRQQSAYNRDEELVMAVELMKFVIRKTLSVMDYQRTISAQREINNMLGLYAPEKSESKVIVTFEDKAIALIQAGKLDYPKALEVFDGRDELVRQLFARANVAVTVSGD